MLYSDAKTGPFSKVFTKLFYKTIFKFVTFLDTIFLLLAFLDVICKADSLNKDLYHLKFLKKFSLNNSKRNKWFLEYWYLSLLLKNLINITDYINNQDLLIKTGIRKTTTKTWAIFKTMHTTIYVYIYMNKNMLFFF